MKSLILLPCLCLCVPGAISAAIITYTSVQVLAGPGANFIATSTLNGSQTFNAGFGPPGPIGPYPLVTLSYNGSSTVAAGILRANINFSVGSMFTGASPAPAPNWGGVSGAAIAEWADTWSLASSSSFSNGGLTFRFAITGTGEASMNLYGTYDNGTPFSLTSGIGGFGARSVDIVVPITTHGAPKVVKARLIAGGGGFSPFPNSYSSSYQNTVILSALTLKDSTGAPIPFSLATASGDPFFAALVPAAEGIPEPHTWSLAIAGLAALLISRRHRLS